MKQLFLSEFQESFDPFSDHNNTDALICILLFSIFLTLFWWFLCLNSLAQWVFCFIYLHLLCFSILFDHFEAQFKAKFRQYITSFFFSCWNNNPSSVRNDWARQDFSMEWTNFSMESVRSSWNINGKTMSTEKQSTFMFEGLFSVPMLLKVS